MNRRPRATFTMVETPPAQMAPITAAGEAVWPAGSAAVLDDNEIVQFSVKPSLWYIIAVSYKFVLVTALLSALTWIIGQQGAFGPWTGSIISFWLAVGTARVAVAALQWASRLYVLTNRRVLCFRGVFNVRFSQCLLTAVSVVNLQLSWCAKWQPIGHIHMFPVDELMDCVQWECVASADEVHDIVVRAIRRSQFGG